MKRFAMFTAFVLTIAALAVPAYADNPVATVTGAGKAALTDPDDNNYAGNVFAIAGLVYADGTAQGSVEFLFAPAFSGPWGALPGVDFIHLKGKITAGAVAADGAVILMGTVTETDYSWADGVVFEEKDVPFAIMASPGSDDFSLQWCLLPVFGMQVTNGTLTVK